MARFHTLTVTDIHNTIRDAVVVTLKPDDPEAFDFTQGQYLTFRHDFDGQELRRSYSICAGRDEGILQIGIKRVTGGAFSNWANDNLRPGVRLEAMAPMGTFHTPIDAGAARQYLGFAGGSGITPLLSVIKTTLAREPGSRFTLIYANRSVTSIMFREELEDLKNHHMGRFNVIHILEEDAQEIELFTGRVDAAKCAALFKGWVDIAHVDTAFICGPEPMMLEIVQALKDHKLSAAQIKYELFASDQPGRLSAPVEDQTAQAGKGATAIITLDGASRTLTISPGETVLEAALAANMDAPFACRAGVCSTCKARVSKGEVEMRANHALEDYEVEQGFVLTCQSVPVSDKIELNYDN